jgi:hypothetical protein
MAINPLSTVRITQGDIVKKHYIVFASIFFTTSVYAGKMPSAAASSESREIAIGKAIPIDTSQAYTFPDTNIRVVLVNRDLYAMLDKNSGSKGAYVTCPEIYVAEQFASKKLYFTDYFGVEHAPSVAEQWRWNAAIDAVGKQANYVGFACKIGSESELMPIIRQVALEAAVLERKQQIKQVQQAGLKKLESWFGRYSDWSTENMTTGVSELDIHNGGTELSLQLNTMGSMIPLSAKIPAGKTFWANGFGCHFELTIDEVANTVHVHIPPKTNDCSIGNAELTLHKR